MMGQNGLWAGLDGGGVAESYDPAAAERRRDDRASARDVKLPPCTDPALRDSFKFNLLGFLLGPLASLFPKPFGPDHLQMIADIQDGLLTHESYVLVAPRGVGKSTIVIGAAIWGILYGHCRCLVILCDNGSHSSERLDSIRLIIETNERLADLFPGPCYCVRALQGNWNRANGQTVRGRRTFIRWGGFHHLMFPSLQGEPSSGACIVTRSMKKAVRGIVITTPAGEQLRPDFALIDDPLEKDDAESPRVVQKVITKIDRDVMFLGPSGARISAILLTTVMAHEDVACHYLSPQDAAGWRRRKFQKMKSLPTNTALWDAYADLRQVCRAEMKDLGACNDFYLANRAEMDAGAVANWEHGFDPKRETSAVQNAMNILIDEGKEAFMAECQNIPPEKADGNLLILTAWRVEQSVREGAQEDVGRGIVPENALALALGADVNKYGLHFALVAAAPGRVATIVDYGVQEVHAPVGRIDPNDGAKRAALEAALRTAIHELHEKLIAEPRAKPSGETVPLSLACLDSNWETGIVRNACAEIGGLFIPIVGHGTGREMPRWFVPRGVTLTPDRYCYCRNDAGLFVAHANVDAYKQMIHSGFMLDADAPGSIRLFTGAPTERKIHHTFARHLVAERPMEKPSGQTVWEKVRGLSDNHYLDALVYAFAALSIIEYSLPEIGINALEPQAAPAGAAAEEQPRRVGSILL